MLIFVNYFLLRLRIRCSVCQSNTNTHDSALTSCSFLIWLSNGFSMHTLGSSHIGCTSKFQVCIRVYMLIFVNYFLLRLRIRCSVCQSNMNTHDSALTSCSFLHDYQMDSHWTHTVHLIVRKFKFVYPCLYAHLCKLLPPIFFMHTVLCALLIWILTILLWFLVHYRHDYQLDFLCILGSSHSM
jgi:hypothetical protein